MTDLPDHVRAAMARLKQVRQLALDDDPGWIRNVYGDKTAYADAAHVAFKDDLRTVAYWCIDQQREIDT